MQDTMLMAAKTQPKEWDGSKSAKFTTGKRHMPAPTADNNAPHPLFNMGSRKHYTDPRGAEFKFKPHRQ